MRKCRLLSSQDSLVVEGLDQQRHCPRRTCTRPVTARRTHRRTGHRRTGITALQRASMGRTGPAPASVTSTTSSSSSPQCTPSIGDLTCLGSTLTLGLGWWCAGCLRDGLLLGGGADYFVGCRPCSL